MKNRMKWYWGLRFLVFGVLAVVAMSVVVMLLWNAVLPAVLGVSTVTWLQALGIVALSRILFGSWGGGRRHSGRHRGWKTHWRERWEAMSPEEREAMKQKWAEHGGSWGRRGRGRCDPSETSETDISDAKEVS